MPHQPASQALARYTVLDLTRVRAGPTAVRQLADWGADVIKIEQPTGDPDSGPGGPRAGSDFQNLHRNKRSLTLNLKVAEGREVFFRLVARADVVVENYRPDVKDRLGIGYDRLKAVNPRIVLASISGFGQDGPYAERPGFDQIAQGMGGLMSITGLPGQGPVRAGIPVADLSAGLLAAQAILIALLERETSGEGQWVQTSLLQAQVFMLDFQAARWLVDREVPGQAGNNHPTSIPTGVFPTSDGHINIAVAGQAIWLRFLAAIGAPQLNDDPAYASAGRALAQSRRAQRGARPDPPPAAERRLDRDAQRRGRAVRPDQHDRPGVRRPPGAPPRPRPAGALARARRHRAGRPADRHEPDAVPHPHGRRRGSASTATRSCASSATTTRRSARCARPGRFRRSGMGGVLPRLEPGVRSKLCCRAQARQRQS